MSYKQVNRNKIAQEKKKRKQELLLKMNQTIKSVSASQSSTTSLDQILADEKRKRKRMRKDLHAKQKQLASAQAKVKELQGAVKEKEDTIKKLKYEKWGLLQKLSRVSELEEQNESLRRALQSARAKLQNKRDALYQVHIERNREKKSENKQKQLAEQVKQLQEANGWLKRKLQNNELIAREENGNTRERIKSLEHEVRDYRNFFKRMEESPEEFFNFAKRHMKDEFIPDLLQLISSSIRPKALKYFYKGSHNVFYLLMRRVGLVEYKTRKQNTPLDLKLTKNSNEYERLGYLVQAVDSWVFVDITSAVQEKTYPVNIPLSIKRLKADKPVKAVINEGEAIISSSFSYHEGNSDGMNKQHSEVEPSLQRTYAYFGDFKVLVIGSRFLSDYRNRLEKHGCKVEVHNPYEQGYELLKGCVSRAEIILVCERHVPHSVWDYVNKSQPYVSVLKQDSKDIISTMCFLTLQRCELI